MSTNHLITTEAIPSSIISRRTVGVQIGFEFEICIPVKSVKVPGFSTTDLSWLSGKTLTDLFEGYSRHGYVNFGRLNDGAFDGFIFSIFKTKRGILPTPGLKKGTGLSQTWINHQLQKRREFLRLPDEEFSKIYWEKIRNSIRKLQTISRNSSFRDGVRDSAKESISEYINRVRNAIGVDIPKIVRTRQTPVFSNTDKNVLTDIASDMRATTDTPVDKIWFDLRNSIKPEYVYDTNVLEGNFTQFRDWVVDTFGTDRLDSLLSTKWALHATSNIKRDTLLKVLWAYMTPDIRPSQIFRPSSGRVYAPEMTTWLKDKLQQIFGTVEVFGSYHQETKKLDRWYIEPDGSLRPNTGDFAAEVVGPPLPVKQAIEALQKFFAFCKQNDIYTNSSTGLHINVSIPGNIDPLKLIIFSGDTYALKKFGRENSTYARSIINNLRNYGNTTDIIANFSKSSDQSAIPAAILDAAKGLARDHFSSVNITSSGYVSFRHAGGNYLSDVSSIMIVLRNFVRAMVLAANPEIGKEQYLAKLLRLIPEPDTPSAATPSFQDIRKFIVEHGIPIVIFQVVIFNSADNTRDNIMQSIEDNRNFLTLFKADISTDEWRDQFISGGGLRLSTIEMIKSLPRENFHTLICLPRYIAHSSYIGTAIDIINKRGSELLRPYGFYDDNVNRVGVAKALCDVVSSNSPEFRSMAVAFMNAVVQDRGEQVRPRLPG